MPNLLPNPPGSCTLLLQPLSLALTDKYYYNDTESPVNKRKAESLFPDMGRRSRFSVTFAYLGALKSPGLDAFLITEVVGWAALNDPGAIAVTIIWANTRTKIVVDIDTIFNLDSGLAWTQATLKDDPDDAVLPTNTGAYDNDVQNIMTHEAGHWLVLNDLYTDAASEQTMYGYAGDGEVKKRSLESGDMAGVLKIYP
jgi:hypothetical protein